ncbi:hypothetical protein GLOTRDRAFT_131690 [Gloeophyllum trabeum ATCC 11539]|uniref:F-box domain-containing protein n=1 Tax=Gloeophyllum trabeum (strain ATCC 11539 / FP-39264 / Madison 617) TaxID=670483 RepID=S7RIN3_GLOTA|nr:uncharacterized protein GLOTRDRAFT_131690 [Gloeophyllum trabeum ATCC 11539]EPQ52449.1 hypothetical protein GLOTRDRAFT_131690 [Gloeophyllum trabeum ATCC 11539]
MESTRLQSAGYSDFDVAQADIDPSTMLDILPDEILREILSHCFANSTSQEFGQRDVPFLQQRTAIMLTCGRFYRIIEDKIFCKYVTISSPHMMATAIQKSGELPLFVDGTFIRFSEFSGHDMLRLGQLINAAARILSLDLTTSRELLRQWTRPMPMLEELTLKRTRTGHHNLGAHQNEEFLLVPFRSSHLWKLHLKGFTWRSIESLLTSAVEDCSVKDVPGKTATRSFLRGLGQMPNLRRLNVATDMKRGNVQDPYPVTLTHLESLAVRVKEAEDAKFLACITAPSLRQLSLSILAPDDDVPAIMGYAMSSIQQIAANQDLQSAWIDAPESRRLFVSLGEEESPHTGVHLMFKNIRKQKILLDLVKEQLGPYLHTVENLELSDGDGYLPSAKISRYELFETMGRVRYLRVQGRASEAIPSGLAYRKGNEKEYRTVFPQLEDLILESVRFRPHKKKSRKAFLNDLIRSFQHRDQARKPKHLTVCEGTGFRETDIPKLKRFVDNVELT